MDRYRQTNGQLCTVYIVYTVVHFGVGFKALFGESFAVELDFAVGCRADVSIPNTLFEDFIDVEIHLGHPKPFPVRYEM